MIGRFVIGWIGLLEGESGSGQQTPGTKRALKQRDLRRLLRSRRRAGQPERSRHFPGEPFGVVQITSRIFPPSFVEFEELPRMIRPSR